MFAGIVSAAKTLATTIAPKVPAIGFGLGIVAIGAGVVFAVKAAVEHGSDEEEDLRDEIDQINEEYEELIAAAPEEEVKKLQRKRKRVTFFTKIKRRIRGMRHYIKAAIALAVGVALLFASFGLLRRANLRLIGSLAAVTQAADAYRERIEELDPEAHAMATYGTEKQDVEIDEVDENGEAHRVKYENADVSTRKGLGSPYARIFDRTSSPEKYDTTSPYYNQCFLEGIQQELRNALPNRKFIRYNEFLRKAGMEECEAGDRVGWAADLGDGIVDLRVKKIFVPNGDGTFETVFGIDPNVCDITPKMQWRRKF